MTARIRGREARRGRRRASAGCAKPDARGPARRHRRATRRRRDPKARPRRRHRRPDRPDRCDPGGSAARRPTRRSRRDAGRPRDPSHDPSRPRRRRQSTARPGAPDPPAIVGARTCPEAPTRPGGAGEGRHDRRGWARGACSARHLRRRRRGQDRSRCSARRIQSARVSSSAAGLGADAGGDEVVGAWRRPASDRRSILRRWPKPASTRRNTACAEARRRRRAGGGGVDEAPTRPGAGARTRVGDTLPTTVASAHHARRTDGMP